MDAGDLTIEIARRFGRPMESLARRRCGASERAPAVPYNDAMRITVNGVERSAGDRTTIADLVRELGLEGKRIAVERNGEIVPRSRLGETALASGDRLEIVGAVGGG